MVKKKTSKKRTKMPPKRRRFVDEYLIDLNATQATIRAGYSKKTAYSQGERLLKNAEISTAVASAIEARSKRTQMDADEVLLELARLARSDILQYVSFDQKGVALRESTGLTEDQARAIAEVSETVNAKGVRRVRFRLHDKIRALELLAKHLGLIVERREHSGKDGKPIGVQFTDEMVASLRRKMIGDCG
jgi:phage terminase small subunit